MLGAVSSNILRVFPSDKGRVLENCEKRRSAESVEGVHPLLRPYRSPHRPHIHLPRAHDGPVSETRDG